MRNVFYGDEQKSILIKGGVMNLKKTLIVFTVLVLALCVSAQFSSFRYQSTAGILYGDIEHIIVPGEMAYVGGFNLYTNLSNFAGGGESLLSPFSSSNYLVGGKFNYDVFHMAVLHRSSGYMNHWIYSDIDNYYEDLVGNTEYDFHYTDSMYDNDKDVYSSEDTYVGLAYGEKETMRFGFAYWRDQYQYSDFWNYNNFYSEYDIEFGDNLYNYYEGYDYQDHYSDVEQRFMLSFYQPISEMDFGLTVFYEAGTEDELYMELDSMNYDNAPDAAYDSYYEEVASISENIVENTMLFGGYMMLRRDCEDYLGEFSAGYVYTMAPQTETFYEDGIFWSFETEPTAINNWTQEINDTLMSVDANTYLQYNNQSMNANLKYVRKLEKVLFGVGAGFSAYINGYEGMFEMYEHNVEEYDDGDGIDDAGDYVYEETGTFTVNYESNGMTHTVNLPVGVEWYANNSLCFRLGSRTTFSWSHDYESEKYSAFEPMTAINTQGDGTVTEWIIDDPSTRTDWEDEYHGFSKYTVYSYGLGWNVTDDFSVDIMGFSNLTDLSGWRVSANATIF